MFVDDVAFCPYGNKFCFVWVGVVVGFVEFSFEKNHQAISPRIMSMIITMNVYVFFDIA